MKYYSVVTLFISDICKATSDDSLLYITAILDSVLSVQTEVVERVATHVQPLSTWGVFI